MQTSSNTDDAETGYESFDNISPWTTPLSSASASMQHGTFGENGGFLSFQQSNASVYVPHSPQQLTTGSTDGVGTWMDGVPLPIHRLLGFNSSSPDMPFYDQDFILFDDALQPGEDSSRAAAEVTTLLAPSITMSPPASPHNTLPPSKRAKHTHLIPRTPPRRRAPRPRLSCITPGCNKTFSRTSDLERHVRNIHGLSNEYYECISHRCLYRTRRKDKMQEHCQRVHAHARGEENFATVEDGDGTTPGSSAQEC